MNKLFAFLAAIVTACIVFLEVQDRQGQPVVIPTPPPIVEQAPSEVEADGAIVAKCVAVTDVDTIKVMIDGKEQSIRVADVDCPETRGSGGQPFGKAAKLTSQLCFGQQVRIVQTGKHFDRIVAYVLLPNGEFLQHELLRAGLAWMPRSIPIQRNCNNSKMTRGFDTLVSGRSLTRLIRLIGGRV